MSHLQRKALGNKKRDKSGGVGSRNPSLSPDANSRYLSPGKNGRKSRQASRQSSRRTSRVNSRAASRANSDDEGSVGDLSNMSVGSIDEIAPYDGRGDLNKGWQEDLAKAIDAIQYKRQNDTIADVYAHYARILSENYAKEEIYFCRDDLIAQFLNSIKSGRRNEGLMATKALLLTMVTDPTNDLYDKVKNTFQEVIKGIYANNLKSAAIHALSAAAFYGGAFLSEIEELMRYFLRIIVSDGDTAKAKDDAGVVTAALQEWGFLCTQLDDAEKMTKESMNGFVDQLDSTDVHVQIAAGENIALAYEKSYTEAEEDELDDLHEAGTKFIKRYDPLAKPEELIDTLTSLSHGSNKSISKKDKKAQHTAFSDILHSVENPLKGPKYSEALDKDRNVRGSRMKVRMRRNGVLKVDKWWKLFRLQHLKRILAGGLLVHWEENPVIFESLSLFLED